MTRLPRQPQEARVDTGRPAAGPRVWIMNHYASTPRNAGGVRHYALAKAVVTSGGEATVFAAGFSHGRGDDGDSGVRRRWRLVRDQVIDGVRFTWVRTLPYQGNTFRRVLNMLSYAVMVALAELGRPRPDVVVGSTVHPFAALAGWYVARRRGARFVYEVRDLWPQTMIDIGEMRATSPAARALYALEAFLVRRADVVLTVLPGMAAYLAARGLPTDHVLYLPNGPDLAELDAAAAAVSDPGAGTVDDPDPSLRAVIDDMASRRAAGQVVFLYAGAHGLVNRLDVILEAVAALEAEGVPVHVVFVGDGPEKARLERHAAERGLKGVRFLDPIARDQVPALLAAADAGLLHYTRTPVYRYGVSFNKLFDYMAARLPVIFACESVNDPIAESGGGLSVPPDDPEALARAMRTLVERSPQERREMGLKGRAWVAEHHDMARLSRRFLGLVGIDAGDGDGEKRQVPLSTTELAGSASRAAERAEPPHGTEHRGAAETDQAHRSARGSAARLADERPAPRVPTGTSSGIAV